MNLSKNTIPADWMSTPYFLTKKQVAAITGYSTKHIDDLVSQGLFPAPRRLDVRCTPRWLSTIIAEAMKATE